ncbi:MAG TPA: Asp-tRNA(Asn)/Glu-tRNA(Gln) amidotransferase subunit GatC [Nitrospiraceae bacterium]|nr:Asp-tRNA(Asn)/Glu-tRNA(Gln) amidotransferase subunit GatC [Nitrospiraceae bacterium]
MSITTEQVEHVAKLARLRLSEEEKALFSGQLSKILEYVEQLKAIGTEGVDHTASGLDQPGPLRDDEVRPSLSAEAATANAAEAEGGAFLVPKVIQER